MALSHGPSGGLVTKRNSVSDGYQHGRLMQTHTMRFIDMCEYLPSPPLSERRCVWPFQVVFDQASGFDCPLLSLQADHSRLISISDIVCTDYIQLQRF